jgi:RHS repeat-associated protein
MTRVAHIQPIATGGRPPEGRVVPVAAWGAVGWKALSTCNKQIHSALKAPPISGEGLGRGFSGETAVSQKLSWWSTPYQFTGKEKDDETGYNYFGARYYNSDVSVWLSVDPLADKYPSMSPYMYCAGNPVMLVDPDGMRIDVKTTRYKTMRDGTERQLKKFSLRRADRIEKTITVSDMKLIDLTGKVSKEKLEETARGIQQEIMDYWNTSNSTASDENGYLTNKRGQKLRVTTVFTNDIEVVESKDQIAKMDHVLAIASELTLERHGGSVAGMTLYQGTKNNNVLITSASNLRPGFGDYAHEFGHMMGLGDVMIFREGDQNRLMYNGNPLISLSGYAPRLKPPLPKPTYNEFRGVFSTGNYIPIKSVRNL